MNMVMTADGVNRARLVLMALLMVLMAGMVPGIGAWTGMGAGVARADEVFKQVRVYIDRTAGHRRGLKAKGLKSLRDLFSTSYAYISVQVALDGSDPAAVTTRVEESATPDPVPCDARNYGRLIMGADMEYLMEAKVGDTNIFVSIFPGERTEFPYNDVSCVYDGKPGTAVFQITGFYYVIANRVKGGIMLQLRPVKPTFKDARRIVARNALERLHDRFEEMAAEQSSKVRARLQKWRQKMEGMFKKR